MSQTQSQTQSQCQKHLTKKKKSKRSKDGGFRLYRVSMDIPLAPVHLQDLTAGVQQALEKFLTRYIPSLGFVFLTYDPETLEIEEACHLVPPTAMMPVKIMVDCLGWRPTMGSRLSAKLVHQTRTHVSLILYNIFNATVSADHFPSDRFKWDPDRLNPHGHAASTLPIDDFYADRWKEMLDQDPAVEQDNTASSSTATQEQAKVEQLAVQGCWVDVKKDKPIGDVDGYLDFTVVALTIANSTLSVHGSLLDDPFEKSVAGTIPLLPLATANQEAARRQQASDNAPADDDDASSSSDDEDSEQSKKTAPLSLALGKKASKAKAKVQLSNGKDKGKTKNGKASTSKPESKSKNKHKMDVDEDPESAVVDLSSMGIDNLNGHSEERPKKKRKKEKKDSK